MDDKERFEKFLKVLFIILWASIAIGTTATALNSFPGAFLVVISLLNLAVTGFALYKVARGEWKLTKGKDE